MKNVNNNKLGRGLDSLLGEKKINLNSSLINFDSSTNRIQNISTELLKPNRFQPRKEFNEEELTELSISIKENGILQPIIVRKFPEDNNFFEIIAGERRFRAAKLINMTEVPVIVKEFDDKKALSLAIIENIQRVSLSPLEEAESFNVLIEKFEYSCQEISDFIGKSRSHVLNYLRLLSLPQEIKNMLNNKQLEMGHARALINSENALEIAEIAVKNNLTVREIEKLVKEYTRKDKNEVKKTVQEAQTEFLGEEYFKKIENALLQKICLKSKINFNPKKNIGKIVIKYKSIDELEKFLKIIVEKYD